MDYYNIDSDVADSSDFLSPPVCRTVRNISRERITGSHNNSHSSNVQLLRDFRTTVTKQTPLPNFQRTGPFASSTSLVLQKTTHKEVLEQYSVLSYTNLNRKENKNQTINNNPAPKDRPLIKVTVIPNTHAYQTQTTKFRKRKRQTKKVQGTVSNQENSIKAENVYLIVAGRKKEKIYEIKTTGSAEFANQSRHYLNDEDFVIEQASNYKQLIKSLNMDNKKKKTKKKEIVKSFSNNSLVNDVLMGPDLDGSGSGMRFCLCSNAITNTKDVKPQRSRVNITGRLGLTNDERYVLKCDATVGRNPVIQNYTQAQHTAASVKNTHSRKPLRNQRDSNIQADYINEDLNRNFTTNFIRSKETQCNFYSVCCKNMEKIKILSNKDQAVQCNCVDFAQKVGMYNDRNTNKSDNESEDTNACHNPLVIISVYPKQNSAEKNTEKAPSREHKGKLSPTRTDVYNVNMKQRVSARKLKTDNNLYQNVNRPLRTRSPSPEKSPTRPKVEKKQIGTRATRKKTGNEECTEGQINVANYSKTQQKKLNSEYSKFDMTLIRPTNKKAVSKTVKQNSHEMKASTTDYKSAKKALVDTYTRQLAKKMDQKKADKLAPRPRRDVSNVTIDIDGQDEYYNVLFHQGDITTGLSVRKTVKEQGSQKSYYETEHTASLENFLLGDEGEPRRSFSQKFFFSEPPKNPPALQSALSRLNLRDSVEITHRREERVSLNVTQIDYSNSKINKDNSYSKFFAPIKHYRGDDCALANPVERDREIRELLGIQKNRPKPSTSKIAEELHSTNEDKYLFETKRDNYNANVMSDKRDKGLCSFLKLFPPCFCSHENNKEEADQAELREIQNEEDDSSSNIERDINEGYKGNCNKGRYESDEDKARRNGVCEEIEKGYRDEKRVEQRYGARQVKEGYPDERQAGVPEEIEDKCRVERRMGQRSGVLEDVEEGYRDERGVTGQDGAREEMRKGYRDERRLRQGYVAREKSERGYRDEGCIGICKETSPRGCEEGYAGTGQQSRLQNVEQNRQQNIQQSHQQQSLQRSRQQSHEEDRKHILHSIRKPNNSGKPADSQFEPFGADQPPLYQQLILNRNINVYLQIEQFTKQKPIVLSRKQYDKVKKAIENVSLKKRKMLISRKSSIISVGQVRKKPKNIDYNRAAQADVEPDDNNTHQDNRKSSIRASIKEKNYKEKTRKSLRETYVRKDDRKISVKDKGTYCDTCANNANDNKVGQFCVVCGRRQVIDSDGGITCKDENNIGKAKNKGPTTTCECYINVNRPKFISEGKTEKPEGSPVKISTDSTCKFPKHAASSLEFWYTNVSYMKQVTFSSTDVAVNMPFSTGKNNYEDHSDSVHTIFKGHHRSATPNLGTSAFSLSSSSHSDEDSVPLQDTKPRRPFLRRLISCFVMRSKTSQVKIGKKVPKQTSVNSSIDSYHISTSLGGIDLSSSIYDTSASFYSNHTVLPVNSKMKRTSFFSSVRGFLTSYKG